MGLRAEIQYAILESDHDKCPAQRCVEDWVFQALRCEGRESAQLTVRFVNAVEGEFLNKTYRNGSRATNVLSFPFELPELDDPPLLGDIVICVPVVLDEIKALRQSVMDYWALMVIHGVFHLLGYDHIDDRDADIMIGKEVAVMSALALHHPNI